jgi:orotidine-5'-phosphate decarboxylase
LCGCSEPARRTTRWDWNCTAGPDFVARLAGEDKRVFLDLKLHDIPNTVSRAVTAVAKLGADLLTVHALGGPAMLEAAVAASAQARHGPRILAVTLLTSMDAYTASAAGLTGGLMDHALRLADLAARARAHGVVCSAWERREIARRHPSLAALVPGIRPVGADPGDQARVASPAEAVREGADYLVVGRAVTRAPDPRAALARVLDEVRLAAAARLPAQDERGTCR